MTQKLREVRITVNRRNGNPHAACGFGREGLACLELLLDAAYAPKFISSLNDDGCSVTLARSAIQSIA